MEHTFEWTGHGGPGPGVGHRHDDLLHDGLLLDDLWPDDPRSSRRHYGVDAFSRSGESCCPGAVPDQYPGPVR